MPKNIVKLLTHLALHVSSTDVRIAGGGGGLGGSRLGLVLAY